MIVATFELAKGCFLFILVIQGCTLDSAFVQASNKLNEPTILVGSLWVLKFMHEARGLLKIIQHKSKQAIPCYVDLIACLKTKTIQHWIHGWHCHKNK